MLQFPFPDLMMDEVIREALVTLVLVSKLYDDDQSGFRLIKGAFKHTFYTMRCLDRLYYSNTHKRTLKMKT